MVLWAALGVLSYAFGVHTRGLAFPESLAPSGVGYVTDLHSSGANDNVPFGMGAVIALVAVAWGGVRFERAFAALDVGVHAGLLSVQLLLLLSVEAGSMWFTIVSDANLWLALWLVAYAALWVALIAGAAFAVRERSSGG